MLISFLKHGTGSARSASGYVLAPTDALGDRRAGVEVLRGDPELVAAVADGLRFKHRYTSGVIAWAPEDRPDDAEIGAVLDDFEELAFAGLSADRRCWSAVLHREPGGGVHVHVLAARCDLQTGRSLNIAPPGWLNDYRPLRDMHNLEHGWAEPDDPARRRDSAAPSFELKQRKAALRQGREFRPDRESIAALLTEAIEDGLVAGRADVAAHLSELGEITRQGKDYISVKPHGAARAIRLKGAIYDAEFDAGRWLAARRADPAAPGGAGRDPGAGPEAVAGALRAARAGFRRAVERRAEHNLQRYGENAVGYGQGSGPGAAPDPAPVAAGSPGSGAGPGDPGGGDALGLAPDPAPAGAAGPEPFGPDDGDRPGRQPLDPVPGGHGDLGPGGRAAIPYGGAALSPDSGPELSDERDRRNAGPGAGEAAGGGQAPVGAADLALDAFVAAARGAAEARRGRDAEAAGLDRVPGGIPDQAGGIRDALERACRVIAAALERAADHVRKRLEAEEEPDSGSSAPSLDCTPGGFGP